MKITEIQGKLTEHADILKNTLAEDEHDLWRDAQWDPRAAEILAQKQKEDPKRWGGGGGDWRSKSSRYSSPGAPRKSYPQKAAATAKPPAKMVTLNVPYAERELAKAQGARWNPELKKWTIDDKFLPNLKGKYDHWVG